jgi:hypothetical protein
VEHGRSRNSRIRPRDDPRNQAVRRVTGQG